MKRNSSIELLRILSILMIIFHHYSVHGGWSDFSASNYSWQTLFIQWIGLGGKIACNIFILITGYYSIKQPPSIKKIIFIIVQMSFYATLITFITYFADKTLLDISLSGFIKNILSVFWGSWFGVTYVILCFLSPFLNSILVKLSKDVYIAFFSCIALIYCIIPFITECPPFNYTQWKFSNIDSFIIMYIIGAYIRIYGIPNIQIWKKSGIILAGILLLSVLIADLYGIMTNHDIYIQKACKMGNINTLCSVGIAITLFLVFNQKNFYNALINKVAATTFGIYLIHDNNFIRYFIWKKIVPNNLFFESIWLPLHMIIKVSAVFIICMFIDLIRIYIIHPLFVKFYEIISNKVHVLWEKITFIYRDLFRRLFN